LAPEQLEENMKPIHHTALFQEIHQQPAVISRLLSQPQDAIIELVQQIHARRITQVYIAARGTSDNAARYAQYLLGAYNNMLVSLATPSLFTVYRQSPNLSNTLVLGISQSGKSPDIISVLAEGKRQGALTAAITNTADSPLGHTADIALDLQAGVERSLAATKTYTAQLACLARLSFEIHPGEELRRNLEELSNSVEKALQQTTHINSLAERYRYMTHCVVLSRGFNYATAFEFSLKMKELTYTIAEPYSSADFQHGPLALIDSGFPVFIFAPGGLMVSEFQSLVEKFNQRGAEVIMVSDHPDLLKLTEYTLTVPDAVPEWLSPITTIIPGQLFAMYLANTRGLDVDNPRGLKKITETW
jgi:glucosamine--fructose-6-phosphate aminotransferase (isomerizing)